MKRYVYVMICFVGILLCLTGCSIGLETGNSGGDFVNPHRIDTGCEYHLPENGVCAECGIAIQDSQGLEFALSEDGSYYICVGIGTCTDTQIVIPAQYEQKPVAAIGNSAFAECTRIKSFVLPDGILSIGEEAFKSCRKCEHFQIPDTVEAVGKGAFKHCKQLKEFRIPASLQEIPDEMLEGCYRLKTVVMPETVRVIGSHSFDNCQSLEPIELPPQLTEIGSYAFYQCAKLQKLVIPASVQAIGQGAFDESTNINEVVYRGSLADWLKIDFGSKGNPMTVCDRVLIEGAVLPETVVIPTGITELKNYSFDGSKTVKSITLHNGIEAKNVPSLAFYGCPSLTDLYIETTQDKINSFKKTVYFSGNIHYVTEGDS